MNLCPHCDKRPIGPGCTTCSNSFCQQASYHLNMAATYAKRRRGPTFTEHNRMARDCEKQARRWP